VANRANLVRALLLGVACVLLGSALLYNELFLSPLARHVTGGFSELTLEKIRRTQLGFGLAGLLLLGASHAVRRSDRLRRVLSGAGRAPEVLLLLLVGVLPVVLVDLALRPFVVPKTTLFVEDRELGWRMKPDTVAEWGEVRVATNARGLRGPDVAYAKPPGVRRVLFLGDSVTFGFGVARTEDVFPFRVGRELEGSLGAPVEVVNAGVGGYSPWQERIYLDREGLRYAPDLLVVGFVLNDVAEKFALVRYGGTERAWQLVQTANGWLDRWLSGSALVTVVRDGAAVLRFGRDVQLGAAAEEMAAVRHMTETPPEMKRAIERAWQITLGNLSAIFDTARQRDIPALLVVFPYAFQLEPGADVDAQERLRGFAEQRGLPFLDLLPPFRAEPDPAGLMIDDSHLSPAGHALAAREIVARVRSGALLPAAAGE
jgi:lysophospholipase L1-like esterase